MEAMVREQEEKRKHVEIKMEEIYLKQSGRTLPASTRYSSVDLNERLKITKGQAEERRDDKIHSILAKMQHKEELFKKRESQKKFQQ